MLNVSPPLVSIVVPTYNRALELRRCLRSLTEQTYRSFEVLVCDDGSTDETQEVVAEFKPYLDLAFIRCPRFGGPARPRNIGISIAKGSIVAFLDSDDTWLPLKLELSVEAIQNGSNFVYHDMYARTVVSGESSFRIIRTRRLKPNPFSDLFFHGNAVICSSVVVERDWLIAAGQFSELKELIAIEDYELWLRVAKLNCRFIRLKKCLGTYSTDTANSISNPQRLLINLRSVYVLHREAIGVASRSKLRWSNNLKLHILFSQGRFRFSRVYAWALLKKPHGIRSFCFAFFVALFVSSPFGLQLARRIFTINTRDK